MSVSLKSSTCSVVSAALLFSTATPTFAKPDFPTPLYSEVTQYNTIIAPNNDPADIYIPVMTEDAADTLPMTILLPGALVDKSDYTEFASLVARYGFVVVVPNYKRTITLPDGESTTGLLARQEQVNDILSYLVSKNEEPTSPLAGRLNTNKLALMGHSFGGAVGLAAIQDICAPLLCEDEFTRPEQLKAGAFFGTTFRDQLDRETFPPINNDGIPIALIAGEDDGVAVLSAVEETFQQIQQPPATLVTILGANHYAITNEDSPRDSIRPSLEQSVAIETVARWSALFLRANLLKDVSALTYIYGIGDNLDANVNVIHHRPRLEAPPIVPETIHSP